MKADLHSIVAIALFRAFKGDNTLLEKLEKEILEKEILEKEDSISIPNELYYDLREAQIKLNMLESGGVDNWEGYHESLNPSGEKSYGQLIGELKEELSED